MSTEKFIHWRNDTPTNDKGERYANIHLLIGYNQGSITDYQKMAAELRKTFPQATDDEICGSKITKSRSVEGFTIVMWNAHIPEGTYPGWRQFNQNGDADAGYRSPEYHFA